MRLPIDVSKVTMLAGGPAERVVNYATGELVTDKDTKLPLFSVNVVMFTPGDAVPQVVKVKVAGEPQPLAQGAPVKVAGLTVSDWAIDGKHGLAFRAESITQATGSKAA
jgi:hypothetical protein